MKTTTDCPVCGETFTRVHTKGLSPVHCSRACANKAPGRMTEEIRAKIAQRGEKHPNWIGGTYMRDGRVWVWVHPDERHLHPTIGLHGYMRRYHHVWNSHHPEDPVMSDEIVHHSDHDKTNDRIENLEKMSSVEHGRLHALGRKHSEVTKQRMRDAWVRRRNPATQT